MDIGNFKHPTSNLQLPTFNRTNQKIKDQKIKDLKSDIKAPTSAIKSNIFAP
jgi:hypothetical protein